MSNFPDFPSPVLYTEKGTPYLRKPGVALISQPQVDISSMAHFLQEFDPSLEFSGYLDDETVLDGGAQVCKTAGQLCYLSFGPNRTKNDEAEKYFNNIKASGHGSVLEHANYTFLFYGIDRSVTHELVRHRAGFGFSQVSQRYVDGKVLRFVERPEYSADPVLHTQFVRLIDTLAEEYRVRAERLMELQEQQNPALKAGSKTDRRKRVNQAARSCLPNEAEAPIVVTANARGWRHFCEMRCSEHADLQIRKLAGRVLLSLKQVSPILFGDYEIRTLADGFPHAETPYRKV